MKQKNNLVPFDHYIILAAQLFGVLIFAVTIASIIGDIFKFEFNSNKFILAVLSISFSAIVTALNFIILNWDRDYLDKK